MLNQKISRDICHHQQVQDWGTKVIEQLSQDLKREFPSMKGISRTNLSIVNFPQTSLTNIYLANIIVHKLIKQQNNQTPAVFYFQFYENKKELIQD